MTVSDERAARVDVEEDIMTIVETAGAGSSVPEFDAKQERHAYREMLLIRRFEEKAGQLYGMGFIGGFCHLYIGQEAVVVGMQMAIKKGDMLRIVVAGAGGWGNPKERDPERVLEDVHNEKISMKHARQEYGVVIDEKTMQVDMEATRRLRQSG